MFLVTKKICYLFLFLFCSFFNPDLLAQNLKGIYLVDSFSRVPVPDAMVKSEDESFIAESDPNGYINLRHLPTSVFKLVISRTGFQQKEIDLHTLLVSKQVAIIYMHSKISSLEEIKINTSSNNSVFKPISELDIHVRPINSSQDVLRMVPGLFIGQHAGGGKSEQIFLRGFDIDHGTDINLTVDGIPVNMVSHAHGQGYADLHWVIPEMIEKITFNKGPYFAEKGNFTTAGFVEFKTKDYLENNIVKVEGGQFGTFRGITGLNLIKKKKEIRDRSLFFAGEGSFTRGFFESPQNFNRFNGMLKYFKAISEKSILTAIATGFTSKWNASGQIPDRAVENGSIGFYGAIDNTEGGKTSRYNTSFELRTYLNDAAVIRNQVFYTKNKFRLYSNFTFFKEDPVNGDQIRQSENRDMLGYNSSYQKDFYLGNFKTQTRAGLQLRYDAIHDIELTRTKNRSTITKEIMRGDVNELNGGIFWTQKISLSKLLDVTSGLRLDYFSNRYQDQLALVDLNSNSYQVSPKLNFNLKINDKAQLYFYNGRSFHSNDTRVAVQQNGKKVLPPAWGSDLGGIFKLGRKVILQSSIWYLWLDQEFIYVGDEGVVEPGGQTRRLGIDVSVRYEVKKNLFADFDISLANPRATGVAKSESYLPLAPRFTSVGGLTYRKEKGFNGSFRYRFMDDRPANEDNSTVAKGYFIADAAINYTQKKWELTLSIQNVFNTRWKETQFDTESRLQNETAPVTEIHFTPGTPFFAKFGVALFF